VQIYVKSSVFSGAYALAGAAAMLGGVQRATISLVVVIIEGVCVCLRDRAGLFIFWTLN
jgi:H+/Cl- antiporter ClcA